MKLLFILDPYTGLNIKKDTSIAMMREAAARGHELYVCQQHDIHLRNEAVRIKTQAFEFSKGVNWYNLAKEKENFSRPQIMF